MDKNAVFGLNFKPADLFNRPESTSFNNNPNDYTFEVFPGRGRGYVRGIRIGENAALVFFDLTINEQASVDFMPSSLLDEIIFSALCVLTPAAFRQRTDDMPGPADSLKTPFVSTTLNKLDLAFDIPAYELLRGVVIRFPFSGLRKECKSHDQHLCAAFSEMGSDMHWLLLDESSVVLHHKIVELFGHAGRKHADVNILAAQARSLLIEVIRTLLGEHRVSEENDRQMYVKMEEVRSILSSHLESRLPLLPVLARTVAVSESTLKRNFKHFYGTSIYEYYLQAKMEWARQLFRDQSLSVKEVAFRLGYEKPSSFIKIFKRIYHYPPGELKRKQMAG